MYLITLLYQYNLLYCYYKNTDSSFCTRQPPFLICPVDGGSALQTTLLTRRRRRAAASQHQDQHRRLPPVLSSALLLHCGTSACFPAILPQLAMDNSGKEKEAMQLMAEADKKVKASGSFLGGMFGYVILLSVSVYLSLMSVSGRGGFRGP